MKIYQQNTAIRIDVDEKTFLIPAKSLSITKKTKKNIIIQNIDSCKIVFIGNYDDIMNQNNESFVSVDDCIFYLNKIIYDNILFLNDSSKLSLTDIKNNTLELDKNNIYTEINNKTQRIYVHDLLKHKKHEIKISSIETDTKALLSEVIDIEEKIETLSKMLYCEKDYEVKKPYKPNVSTLIGKLDYFLRPPVSFDGYVPCNGGVMNDEQWQRLIDSNVSAYWKTNFGEKNIPDLNGRVLASRGDETELYRGNKEISLTNRNLPKHKHNVYVSQHESHTHTVNPPKTYTSSDKTNILSGLSHTTYEWPVPNSNGKKIDLHDGGNDFNDKLEESFDAVNVKPDAKHKHYVDISEFRTGGNGSQSHKVTESQVGYNEAFNIEQPTAYIGTWFVYLGE